MKKLIGKIQTKVQTVMRGRYGNDRLNAVILFLAFVVVLFNLFTSNLFFLIVINLAVLGLITLTFLRIFSKNLAARRKENEKYLRLEAKVRKFYLFQRKKFSERKTHVYKKCPKCKSTLRLPRQKGKHTVVCPRCRERFHIEIK